MVGVGILGAGWWATSAHIPAILAHPEAELVSIQSRKAPKAARIAADFGARHHSHRVEDVLARADVDAVIVSSTPNVHHAQAKAALLAGKHLLLEKPMTLRASESEELVRLARERDLRFLVSCPWHYTRHGLAARELVRRGRIGRVKMISILMTNPIDRLLKGIDTSPTHGMSDVYVEPNKGSYNDPAIAGGGQIYCQVSHAAAYLTYLTGAGPKEVFARFDNDGSINDIYDTLNLLMEDGALVSIATTGATDPSERTYEVRVYGDQGMLFLELWKGTMCHWDLRGQSHEERPLQPDEIYPDRAPALNLIDSVLNPAANCSDARYGHAAMQVIDAACRSAATGVNVKIEA